MGTNLLRVVRTTLATLVLVFVTGAALAPTPAYAVDVLGGACNNPNSQGKPAICKDNGGAASNPLTGKDGVLTKAIHVIALIVGIGALLGIVVGAIRMIVGAGDSNAVADARRVIIYCLVALVGSRAGPNTGVVRGLALVGHNFNVSQRGTADVTNKTQSSPHSH